MTRGYIYKVYRWLWLFPIRLYLISTNEVGEGTWTLMKSRATVYTDSQYFFIPASTGDTEFEVHEDEN